MKVGIGMEIIVIALVILAAYVVQQVLGKVKVRFVGYIIPILMVVYGTYATIQNFQVLLQFGFTMGSSIATILVVILYVSLTYSLHRVYKRSKEEAEYPYQSLKDRGIL
ncbi:hypothetical protein AYO36_09270 [Exiguobacterium sp. KKBO11]|nr:hypothetical protein AYO36_09270 [Exiguobacterium sp. KKBO11]